jgi:ketosteroid isomerase-like protein
MLVYENARVPVWESLRLVAELHRRQERMHAGGPTAPVADLLADDVVWQVPGASPIAGTHMGWEAVLRHFDRLRVLTRGTLRLHPGEVVAADPRVVVQLVDGVVTAAGRELRWRAAGFYRVERGRIHRACSVPLEPRRFDGVWTTLGKAC